VKDASKTESQIDIKRLKFKGFVPESMTRNSNSMPVNKINNEFKIKSKCSQVELQYPEDSNAKDAGWCPVYFQTEARELPRMNADRSGLILNSNQC
jgi:hypothetical protein